MALQFGVLVALVGGLGYACTAPFSNFVFAFGNHWTNGFVCGCVFVSEEEKERTLFWTVQIASESQLALQSPKPQEEEQGMHIHIIVLSLCYSFFSFSFPSSAVFDSRLRMGNILLITDCVNRCVEVFNFKKTLIAVVFLMFMLTRTLMHTFFFVVVALFSLCDRVTLSYKQNLNTRNQTWSCTWCVSISISISRWEFFCWWG